MRAGYGTVKRESPVSGVLHLLMSKDAETWQACRACCCGEDTVVLLDSAVMGLTDKFTELADEFPCAVIASEPDARARGLLKQGGNDAITVVADADIVELLETHQQCLSWR